jgi:hypothetical protein
MPEGLSEISPEEAGWSPKDNQELKPAQPPEIRESPRAIENWYGVEKKTTEELLGIFRQDGMVLVHETTRPEVVLEAGRLLPKFSLNTLQGLPEQHRQTEARHPSRAIHFSMNRPYNFDVQSWVEQDPDLYHSQLEYVYNLSGKMTGFFAHPGVLATDREISTNVIHGFTGEPSGGAEVEDIAVRGESDDPKSPEHAIDLDKCIFFAPRDLLVYGNGELVKFEQDENYERVTAKKLKEREAELTRSVGNPREPYSYVKRGVIRDKKIEEDPHSVIMRSEDYWLRFFRRMEEKGLKPPKHVFFYDGISRRQALVQFREQNDIPEPNPHLFYERFQQLQPQIVEHKRAGTRAGQGLHAEGEGKFFRAQLKTTE